MKKYLISGGIVLICIVSFITYVYITTKPTIYNTLSPRAKEYLRLRRNANDRNWQSADIDNPDAKEILPATKTIRAEKCFEVTVPFFVSEARKESDCQYRVFLSQPSGTAVLYRRSVEASSLDDVGDVSMRKLYKDQYKEEKIKSNGRLFYVYKRNGDTYEKIAFYLENKQLYVFSLNVPTNQNLDTKFTRLLESIKIYNE